MYLDANGGGLIVVRDRKSVGRQWNREKREREKEREGKRERGGGKERERKMKNSKKRIEK